MNRILVSGSLTWLLLALGSLAPAVASATPSRDACNGTLDWNPMYSWITVYAPGTWCLDHDIVLGDGDAVDSVIRLDYLGSMTIDCRGHLIEYTGSADVTAIVDASGYGGNRVRNCRFRGFTRSIDLGEDYLVEDNVVLSSRGAQNGGSAAIVGTGTGIVRRNRVFDSVGVAISAGKDATVADNLVDGVTYLSLDPEVTAILLTGGGAPQVTGNTVRGLVGNEFFGTEGIRFTDPGVAGDRAEVSGNVLVYVPAAGDNAAVMCAAADTRVADNVISGFTNAMSSCTDGGDNDVSP